jgi:hypothetical protein
MQLAQKGTMAQADAFRSIGWSGSGRYQAFRLTLAVRNLVTFLSLTMTLARKCALGWESVRAWGADSDAGCAAKTGRSAGLC